MQLTGNVLGDIGSRLRKARTDVGISVRELARKAGVSASLVSQIETGKARPSVATLYALVQHLNLRVDELFEDTPPVPTPEEPESPSTPAPAGFAVMRKLISAPMIQHAETRSTLKLEGGITWERLTPFDVPGVDFLKITYDVGGASCPDGLRQTHSGHEFGHLLSGRLCVTVGFDTTEIGPGDSIYFDSSTPHRLHNPGNEPAVGIWMVHAPFGE
ncbi:XRE family transcriptional regulator [Kibdelosporangium philippinense]|uniref:XRE family transcriptional regulator n=1 Tax=Kibdelosporangium philippinense TaxID=211113 RepID=A0ABS8Z926_9PSEU|nr:XRE family transcriptional regulator [Kibdelosporangium philippinense]MCE7004373.1 XRE family transcriptional regulator [Kibdelosporangium philippinense]